MPSKTISLPRGSPYRTTLDACTELSKSVRAILERSGVTAEVFTLCHCQCILFVEDTLVPTLLVVPKKESADEDWLSVSREIYQLLETNDLSQFNVEICDERVTTLSIIMPSNPAPPEPLPCVRCLGNLYAVTNPNCNPWLTGSMGSPT